MFTLKHQKNNKLHLKLLIIMYSEERTTLLSGLLSQSSHVQIDFQCLFKSLKSSFGNHKVGNTSYERFEYQFL